MCTAEGKNKPYELRDGETTHFERLVLATLGDSRLSRRSCGYSWHHRNGRQSRVPSWPYPAHHGDHLDRCADGRVHDRDGTEGADAPVRDESADLILGIHRLQDLGQPTHLPGSLADHGAGQLRTASAVAKFAWLAPLCCHYVD